MSWYHFSVSSCPAQFLEPVHSSRISSLHPGKEKWFHLYVQKCTFFTFYYAYLLWFFVQDDSFWSYFLYKLLKNHHFIMTPPILKVIQRFRTIRWRCFVTCRQHLPVLTIFWPNLYLYNPDYNLSVYTLLFILNGIYFHYAWWMHVLHLIWWIIYILSR